MELNEKQLALVDLGVGHVGRNPVHQVKQETLQALMYGLLMDGQIEDGMLIAFTLTDWAQMKVTLKCVIGELLFRRKLGATSLN